MQEWNASFSLDLQALCKKLVRGFWSARTYVLDLATVLAS